MKTDQELAQERIRGENAAQVIANPAFNEAFDAIRGALLEQFARCKSDDFDRMANLNIQLRIVDSVKNQLVKAMQSGNLAEQQEVRRSQMDRFKKAFFHPSK